MGKNAFCPVGAIAPTTHSLTEFLVLKHHNSATTLIFNFNIDKR